MESNFLKIVLGIAAGFLLALHTIEPKAQTVAIQGAQGQVQGYIQQNGSTVNLIAPNGAVAATGTVYPTQITLPSGAAIGVPSYIVPMTPPSPPSPRVLQ